MAEEFNFITGASIEADGGRWSVVFPGAVLEIRDTLAEALDAVETVTKARADDCAAALRRIREIRAERGLLVWQEDRDTFRAWAREKVRFTVWRTRDQPREYALDVSPHDTNLAPIFSLRGLPTSSAAKSACEQWFREWLDRAGLEVRK